MNAKIDRNGILKVERAGEMQTQCCPYTPGNYTSYCGDWCPKFEEVPENAKLHLSYRVKVCGGPTYEIVADERTKETPHATE